MIHLEKAFSFPSSTLPKANSRKHWAFGGVHAHELPRILRQGQAGVGQFISAEVGQFCSAASLLVTADGGGSNGSRNRLWKVALQRLANQSGLVISVCHFPPGTSKWNKIEHRMFCWITENWRGKPLTSHAVIVNLISDTTTEAGLRIKAAMDTQTYPVGTEVTDEQMAELNIERDDFHGKDWNYSISPQK